LYAEIPVRLGQNNPTYFVVPSFHTTPARGVIRGLPNIHVLSLPVTSAPEVMGLPFIAIASTLNLSSISRTTQPRCDP
jgi:hypothetical protein